MEYLVDADASTKKECNLQFVPVAHGKKKKKKKKNTHKKKQKHKQTNKKQNNICYSLVVLASF